MDVRVTSGDDEYSRNVRLTDSKLPSYSARQVLPLLSTRDLPTTLPALDGLVSHAQQRLKTPTYSYLDHGTGR